jgi:hypothetical protein
MDMAANNNAFIRSLGDIYETELPNVSFNPKESRIMCFPHVINTCVQHTLKALNNGVDTDIDDIVPVENEHDSDLDLYVSDDDDSEGSDDEKNDDEGGGGNGGGNGNVNTSKEENIAISNVPGDPLNKIRAIVRGIRASGQRQEQFTNVILGGNQYGWWKDGQGNVVTIKPMQLLRDVKTRWDSTYQMLVRFREFRQVSCFHL